MWRMGRVMATNKFKGLGRGLDDLIAGGVRAEAAPEVPVRRADAKSVKSAKKEPQKAVRKPEAAKEASARQESAPEKGADKHEPAVQKDVPGLRNVQLVAIKSISKCPWQPRQHFGQEELEELSASIRERGILQPVLLRVVGEGYELIAGERRLRAAEAAGLKEIPALVQEATDDEVMELALIENIQRQNLNPIEEAKGYSFLLARFGSQDEVARRVGKARPSVSNALRLLELSDAIKQAIVESRLSSGHAKVLLGVPEPLREKLAERVIKQGLSVRALEALVAGSRKKPTTDVAEKKPDAAPDADGANARQLRFLEEKIQQALGTKVQLVGSRVLADGRHEMGRMVIEFFDAEDLSRLLETLNLGDLR